MYLSLPQDIIQSLESHQTQIEEAIAKGKDLSQMDGALDLVQANVERLESLSSEVSQDCKERKEELETALNNWIRYNAALESFKEVLANGEVEVTRRKTLNVTGIETTDEQKQEIQVRKSKNDWLIYCQRIIKHELITELLSGVQVSKTSRTF